MRPRMHAFYRRGRARRRRVAARDVRPMHVLPARPRKSLPSARFTGYDHDGGYAEFVVVREDFAYAIPDGLGDEAAAPLLCAGIIGFRAIKRAEIRPGTTVGLYGFGGSAHIAIQVLKHWRCRVFVMSRGGRHQELAEALGADWVGPADAPPPQKLDAAILFAPAGELVLPALEALDRGGILAVAGIYLSPCPRSTTNATCSTNASCAASPPTRARTARNF